MENSDDGEVRNSVMDEALKILKQEGFTLPGDVVDTLKTVAETNIEARKRGSLKGHRMCEMQSNKRKIRNMRESNTKPKQERSTLSSKDYSEFAEGNRIGRMSTQSSQENDIDNGFEDVIEEKIDNIGTDTSSGTASTCSVSTLREAGKRNYMCNTAQVQLGSSSPKGKEEINSCNVGPLGSDITYSTSSDKERQIHEEKAANVRNMNQHSEENLKKRTSNAIKRDISKHSGFTEADFHRNETLKNHIETDLCTDVQNAITHHINDTSLSNLDVCERFVDSQTGLVHAVTTSSSDASAAEMITKSDELLDNGIAVSAASKLSSQECNSNISRAINEISDGDWSKVDEYAFVNKISKSPCNITSKIAGSVATTLSMIGTGVTTTSSTIAAGVTTTSSRNVALMEQGLNKERCKLDTSADGDKASIDISVDQKITRNQEVNNIEQSDDRASQMEKKHVYEKAQILNSHKEEKIGPESDMVYAVVKANHNLEANARNTQNQDITAASDVLVVSDRSDSSSSSLYENISSEKQSVKRSPDSASEEHVTKSNNSSISKLLKTASECMESKKERVENTYFENSNSSSNTLTRKCDSSEYVNGLNLHRMASSEEPVEGKMKSSRSVSKYATNGGTDGEIPYARRSSSVHDGSSRYSISGLSKEEIDPPTYEETLSNLSRHCSLSPVFSRQDSSASSIASSAGALNERRRQKESAMKNDTHANGTGRVRAKANNSGCDDILPIRHSSWSSDSTISDGDYRVMTHPIKSEGNAKYSRSLTDSAIGRSLNRRTASHGDEFVRDNNTIEVRDEYWHRPKVRGKRLLDLDIDNHFGNRQYKNNTRKKYDILKGHSFKREVMNMVDTFFDDDDDDDDFFNFDFKSKHRCKYSDEEFELDRILTSRLDANPYTARHDLSKLLCQEDGDSNSVTFSVNSYAASDIVNPVPQKGCHCAHIDTVSESGYKIPNRHNKHSINTANHSDSKIKHKLRDVDNNQYFQSTCSQFSGWADDILQSTKKPIPTKDKDINASTLDHKVRNSENSARYENLNYDHRCNLQNAVDSEGQTNKLCSSRVTDMSDAVSSSHSAHSLKKEHASCTRSDCSGTSIPDIVDGKVSSEVESNEQSKKRRMRIDRALSWIRAELGDIRTQDKVLTSQFQRCQDSIEQLTKQCPWHEVYGDDEKEDGKH